jgi:sugar phosphate isomerase/epimerase
VAQAIAEPEGKNSVMNMRTMLNRRTFVRAAGAACVANAIRPGLADPPSIDPRVPNSLRLGVVVWVGHGQSIDSVIQGVKGLGLPTCQIGFETLTADVAKPLKSALVKYGIEATALSEHGPGTRVFDFYEGPGTIGIIPRATRKARIRNLNLAADIAEDCGIRSIHTHCGFIPEDPNDPLYSEAVAAVREVASYCNEQGRLLLCETGEETPIALLRLIQDTAMANVFVNLDLANLILYGKGNPVDAMYVIGRLVRGIHAKDGLFPTDPRSLGEEVAIGKGKVDFPAVFEQLRLVGYNGPVTIERETEGDEQREEMLRSKVFLESVIEKAYRPRPQA